MKVSKFWANITLFLALENEIANYHHFQSKERLYFGVSETQYWRKALDVASTRASLIGQLGGRSASGYTQFLVYLQCRVSFILAETFPSVLKAMHVYIPPSCGRSFVNLSVPATLGNVVLFPSFFQIMVGTGTPSALHVNVAWPNNLVSTVLSLGADVIVGETRKKMGKEYEYINECYWLSALASVFLKILRFPCVYLNIHGRCCFHLRQGNVLMPNSCVHRFVLFGPITNYTATLEPIYFRESEIQLPS